MPLKPVSRVEPMPVSTEKDVRALFDLAVSLGRGAPHPGLALAEPHRSMAGHAPSKRIAAVLAEDIGFEAIDADPITNTLLLESLVILWIYLVVHQGHSCEIAFRLVRP